MLFEILFNFINKFFEILILAFTSFLPERWILFQSVKLLLAVLCIYVCWKPLLLTIGFCFNNVAIITYQIGVLTLGIILPVVITAWVIRCVFCSICCCQIKEGFQTTKKFFLVWIVIGSIGALFMALFIYIESNGWKDFQTLKNFDSSSNTLFDQNFVFNGTIYEL